MEKKKPSVRINTTLSGEPAEWLLEWKKRGLFNSNTDAVIQALRALKREIIERDLEESQLKEESYDE